MSGDTLIQVTNLFSPNSTISRRKNNDTSLIDFSKRSSNLRMSNVLVLNSTNLTKTSTLVSKKRIDAYGNEITKAKHKKFHVTFLDRLDEDRKKKLVKVIEVPSFKKYNYKINNNAFDYEKDGAACCNAPCITF